MLEKRVEILDDQGHRLRIYSVLLEYDDCHDEEFEEVALVFAQNDRLVHAAKLGGLRARCCS